MSHASIDRFEGEWAVLLDESGQERRLERATLPPQAREGDVVDLETRTLLPAERLALEARVRAARETATRASSQKKGGSFDL